MTRVMYVNRCLALWSSFLLLGLAWPATAHNGAVAIAVPVEGIKVDGDLSDWPEGMRRYPILSPSFGDRIEDTKDLQGFFQVGYNDQENALYVAVEVQDESIIRDSQGILPEDGCALYIDLRHEEGAGFPIEYRAEWISGKGDREAVKAKVRLEEKGYRYEWRLDISRTSEGQGYIHPGMAIGFDLGLIDKDEDGSLSSMFWSRAMYRGTSGDRLGDVLLVEKGVSLEEAFGFIEKYVNDVSKAQVHTARIAAIFMGVLLAFAVLHLLLFLFYPRSRGNLYYALIAGSASASYFCDVQGQFSTNPEHGGLFSIQIASDGLVAVFVLLFLYSLFYTRLPRQFWLFLLGVIGLGVWQLVQWVLTPVKGIFLLLLGLALLGEALRMLIIAIRQKKPGAWILSIWLVATIFSGLFLNYWSILFLAIPMSMYLARNFAQTSKNLEAQLVHVSELSAKTLEQERRIRDEEVQRRLLEGELQTAHEMQMGLMPREAPEIAGFGLAGRCIPANHVGGDLFQYFQQDGKLSIALADVTGHAMEAAIPMMMFSGILKSQVELGDSVEELFGRLNRSLHGTLQGHTFVCLVMGQLDLSTRRFRFSNAGCPYPYHYHAATGEVVELQLDAYPLGVRPDTTYRGIEVQLEPGDRVVFCSDGIAEAGNASGELFGFERAAETIRRGGAEDLSAEALLERVIAEVREFTGKAPQGDDRTIAVLEVEARERTFEAAGEEHRDDC